MICLCALLLLSWVSGHTALAANTWKMAAKELTKKAQTNLSLRLENSDAVNAFQFDLTLPKGLQLTDKPILNAVRSSGHTLDWTALSGNQYRATVDLPAGLYLYRLEISCAGRVISTQTNNLIIK